MRCYPCVLIAQFFINFLNLADHALNFLLLGDADETVSARIARARHAGWRWAYHACQFLSWLTKLVTFGKIDRDHCNTALDKTIRPNTREIWNWNTMRLNPTPISVVVVVDDGGEAIITPAMVERWKKPENIG